MTKEQSQKTKPVNTLMSPQEKSELDELALKLRLSAGAVVRQAISAMHRHVIQNEPLCANGQKCFVPHMHALPSFQGAVTAPAGGSEDKKT